MSFFVRHCLEAKGKIPHVGILSFLISALKATYVPTLAELPWRNTRLSACDR